MDSAIKHIVPLSIIIAGLLIAIAVYNKPTNYESCIGNFADFYAGSDKDTREVESGAIRACLGS
ncbi:MAG: hypothetical protein ABJN98_12255 [Roseibium sp.]|uniref:hypothetical protein n=1 Tax=Roseibium polysiphoniae TaxID=2571221 RepID=UPI0032995FB8